MDLPNVYESKNYKRLAVIPIVLFLAALAIIFVRGIPQGVDLRGGVLLSVQTNDHVDIAELKSAVEKVARISSIRTFASPGGTGVEIEVESNEKLVGLEEKVKALQIKDTQLRELEVNATTATNTGEVKAYLEKQAELNAEVVSISRDILKALESEYAGNEGHVAVKLAVEKFGASQDDYRKAIISAISSKISIKSYSFREVGPALSKFFLVKSQEILLFSFLLSAIVVFIVFRSLIPSLAVISGAVNDIVITIGIMSLFGIPLSLASIAGLLMLIGFSLDTDVMLTMRVLKRKEDTPAKRAFGAFKTGALMNLTSIGAFTVLALAGLYLQIPVYFELGIVAVIGSCVDFVATWCLNAVLILNHAEKKSKQMT